MYVAGCGLWICALSYKTFAFAIITLIFSFDPRVQQFYEPVQNPEHGPVQQRQDQARQGAPGSVSGGAGESLNLIAIG